MSSSTQITYTEDSANPIAVRFDHVSKTYLLYKNDRQRLLGVFSDKIGARKLQASRDLTFTVGRGESIAFLGNNGAGKSTLLRMVAGVTHPDTGAIEVNGRVSALLNLGAGFDALLTGAENLRQRGHVMGLSTKDIDALLPEIIEFSELGDFIDQPLRTYSSGMKARLGFAFVSALEPDILILDEVMGVGDHKFSKKSNARMEEIMSRRGVTILFVTHSTSAARNFCKRGIVLDHGAIVFDGPIDDAIEKHTGERPE
jgi:teichoic acid transport system ATP-binding protein